MAEKEAKQPEAQNVKPVVAKLNKEAILARRIKAAMDAAGKLTPKIQRGAARMSANINKG